MSKYNLAASARDSHRSKYWTNDNLDNMRAESSRKPRTRKRKAKKA